MRDLDLRIAIKKSFLKKYYEDGSSKVVEELNVCFGDARIDIAVINGSLHGFEIKSESDTLLRLPNQISTYSKIFDYITVVCGESHLDGVLAQVPEWCGVISASEKRPSKEIKLKKVRSAKKNSTIQKYNVAQLLWRNETISCLNELGITKGIKSKNKTQLWQLLSESASEKKLSGMVRRQLKLRADWKPELRPFENDGCFQLFSTL